MKKYFPIYVAVGSMLMGTALYSADNTAQPPVPGTVQSTDTKSSSAQNNTPRVNPTPNPEPDSQPSTTTTTAVVSPASK